MLEFVQVYIPETRTGIEPLLNVNYNNNNLFLSEAKYTSVNRYRRYIFTNSQDSIYVGYGNTVNKIEYYNRYNTFALSDVMDIINNKEIFIYEKIEFSFNDKETIMFTLSNLEYIYPKMTKISINKLREDLRFFLNNYSGIGNLTINILSLVPIDNLKKHIVNLNGLLFSRNRTSLLKLMLGKATAVKNNIVKAEYYVLSKQKGTVEVPIGNTSILVENKTPANIDAIIVEANSSLDSITDVIEPDDDISKDTVNNIISMLKDKNIEELLKHKQFDKKSLTNLIFKLEAGKNSMHDKDIKNILDILKIVNTVL